MPCFAVQYVTARRVIIGAAERARVVATQVMCPPPPDPDALTILLRLAVRLYQNLLAALSKPRAKPDVMSR